MQVRALGTARITGLLAVGAACWAAGIGVIRLGRGLHIFDGTWVTATFFLFTLLGAHTILWLCMRALRLEEDDALVAGAMLSAAALMLHGVALTWLPGLYGADDSVARLGSAWLLWGVGATLVMAWLRARAAPPESAAGS